MEPRFSPRDSTPRSTKNEVIIGGLKVYVYGLAEVKQQGHTELAILYLAHGRNGTYLDVEDVAHEILHQYRINGRNKRAGLIAVAFNMRNHGDRIINHKANLTWSDGNDMHAQDMLSSIAGCAHDLELLIDYLPLYLPTYFENFYNVVSGISLGAHISWRMATSSAAARGKIQGLAIVAGCPNLTALFLSRLGVNTAELAIPLNELCGLQYDQLSACLTEEQRRRWPPAVSEILGELDRATYETFPCNNPTLVLHGMLDQLVPNIITETWITKKRAEVDAAIEYFVYANAGHTCTAAMVDRIAEWLTTLFGCSSGGAGIAKFTEA
ncbi:uncharacterized protein A1O5_07326 [Cladophialophora psammophila CBS 110553]|uniref:AB hydrolase-1 domain-containing protein n=1 Tax=Cladophialophora psammophila CBS 110553 TaxID=1182543 RepID=W9WW47_9EURO|nr:uncharacterized protein A1O5_07326 [Cladophialophora psammophila CBS 110553]EXJ69290.1 hypothetical protein A1O5_07326 [Cladophialophora psammophila CBS 110553]